LVLKRHVEQGGGEPTEKAKEEFVVQFDVLVCLEACPHHPIVREGLHAFGGKGAATGLRLPPARSEAQLESVKRRSGPNPAGGLAGYPIRQKTFVVDKDLAVEDVARVRYRLRSGGVRPRDVSEMVEEIGFYELPGDRGLPHKGVRHPAPQAFATLPTHAHR